MHKAHSGNAANATCWFLNICPRPHKSILEDGRARRPIVFIPPCWTMAELSARPFFRASDTSDIAFHAVIALGNGNGMTATCGTSTKHAPYNSRMFRQPLRESIGCSPDIARIEYLPRSWGSVRWSGYAERRRPACAIPSQRNAGRVSRSKPRPTAGTDRRFASTSATDCEPAIAATPLLTVARQSPRSRTRCHAIGHRYLHTRDIHVS